MGEAEPERVAAVVERARVGRQRWLRWLWRRVYWVTAGVAVAVATVSGAASGAVVAVGLALCLALKLFELASRVAAKELALVSSSRGGLTLHLERGDLALPATAAREGVVREEEGRVVVRVETRDGWRHDLTAPDRATADRWLASLGLDPAHRKARFVTDRAGLQVAFGYFFGGLFAMPGMIVLAWIAQALDVRALEGMSMLAALPGYWFAARSVGRVDMTVGVDGVYAGRGWLRRFFPSSSIERVERDERNGCVLRLVLRTGAVHAYRFADEVDAAAARARVEAILALRATLPASVERVLASSQASTAEAWRGVFEEALRGASYREAALTEADLARVVSAPGVTGAQRVGAALALRAAGAEATGVRVAAEALTAPQTVEALARAGRLGGTHRGGRSGS